MLETISQIMIFVCGVSGAFLYSSNSRYSKYAPVVGLIVQPFWFYTAWQNGQWGVFAVSVFYTASFVYGVWAFWFRKDRKKA